MAKLTANVMVRNPKTGDPTLLMAGSEVPEWASDQVGNHVLNTGESSESGGDVESDADEPPPKAGPGSSRSRWLSYADDHGVRMRDDAAKDDIIAACERAGVRIE